MEHWLVISTRNPSDHSGKEIIWDRYPWLWQTTTLLFWLQ
jgi:hypothetical protein